MSSALKTTLGALVLIVIAGGIYWYIVMQKKAPAPESVTPTAEEQHVDPMSILPSGRATADGALDQDLAGIDAQIGGFDSDNTAVTAGLADQSVPQASL